MDRDNLRELNRDKEEQTFQTLGNVKTREFPTVFGQEKTEISSESEVSVVSLRDSYRRIARAARGIL